LRPITSTASSSSLSQRPSSHVPPSKVVAVIAILKDKRFVFLSFFSILVVSNFVNEK